MSNMSYVFNCLFRNEDCDDFGLDCWCCPYYDEDEDEEVQEERRYWEDDED